MTKTEVSREFKKVIEFLRYGYHLQAAKLLFKKAETPFPIMNHEDYNDIECAKAFWIALIYLVFEDTVEAKIIFNALALYNENNQLGIVARRRNFILSSNYKGKETNIDIIAVDNKDLSEEAVDKLEDSLSKMEKSHIIDLIMRFLEIDNKEEFFISACKKYTHIVPGKRYRCVDISKISSYPEQCSQIVYVKRTKNFSFCGRKKEIDTISDNFANGFNTQILYGMGGSGKTQIALQYAYSRKNEYDTILWIDSTSYYEFIKECKDILKLYSKGVDADSIKNLSVLIKYFCDFVNSRTRCLVIFDNVDYLDKDSKEAQKSIDLLQRIIATGEANFLLTTRCNCDYNGAKRIEVTVFSSELSVEYLQSKTGLVPDDNAKQLAGRLGYLPLALDYVGSYIATQQISYKNYLDLWDGQGTKLFDKKDYAEKTIRQAFKITLDKLRENPEEYDKVMYLLEICAKYKLEYFPIKSFSEYYKGLKDELLQYYRTLIKQGKNPTNSFEDGFVGNSSVHMYKMIEACDDYSEKWECISEENKGNIFIDYPDESFLMLQDELERGEAIRSLTKYSLVSWNGEVLIMHPMLAEIIMDEFAVGQKDDFSIYSFKAEIYDYHGDKESYNKYERLALENKMNIVETTIDSVSDHPVDLEFNSVDLLLEETVKLYPVFVRLLNYADEEMIKRGMRIWFKISKYIYDTDDITHLKEKMLSYERVFYNRLSWQLGHFIIWRRYPTPLERKQSQADYIYECTQIRDFTDSPRLSSAKAAIDVWDIDETDSYKPDGDPSWRVLACKDLSKYNLE